ncbi:hypothetical protein LNP17_14220 [Klebsiella variicola subsp. variicola]|nr:hypothetical protein [Klebsiella variicola subsp. variicola]
MICGSVLSAGQGMGPARQVALRAGIPVQKPAYTLNMICGSGMKSITEGAIHIQSGLCRPGRRWRDGKHEPGAVFAAGER